MLRLFAGLAGLVTLPGFLLETREAMLGQDLSARLWEWWHFPLIGVGVVIGVWVLGQLFGKLAAMYAGGFAVGAGLAVFFVLALPESKMLYLIGVLLTIPIGAIAAKGQTTRMNMLHGDY